MIKSLHPYIQFLGSLENFNDKEFDEDFARTLSENESLKKAFIYALDALLECLNISYVSYKIQRLKPTIFLCFKKDRVFFYVKAPVKFHSVSDTVVELNPTNFKGIQKMHNRTYVGVFDKNREKLKFYRTNIIPNTHWIK